MSNPGQEMMALGLAPPLAVDVGAYLRRIGYAGHLATTLDTLAAISRAHVATIPFENLDVALERTPALHVAALEAKLVGSRRGGYCYEHGTLLAAVLDELGFRVTRHAARVRMGSPDVRPRSHMCLTVEVDGQRWLVDTGFGGDGLLEPVAFGSEAAQGVWRFRLVPDDREEDWRLQGLQPSGWVDLYAFGDAEHFPVDFEVFNHYTATGPRSPLRGRVIAQRASETERRRLVGTTYTVLGAEGVRSRQVLAPEAVPAALAEHFDIGLSASEAAAVVAVAAATAERQEERS